MPADDGPGLPERSRRSGLWPALDVHQADSQTADLIPGLLLDFGIAAIDDTLPHLSRVFFHDPGDRDRAADALRDQFSGIDVRTVDVPDDDWAARSQASLTAVRVGDIVVAPPWDARPGIRESDVGSRGAEPLVIVIQPSMGFGTGHHATTRLCLAALQRIDLRRLHVLDVGTGSGVLAIAASCLGAEAVVAIDDDPDAITAARDNLVLNPEARVELTAADLRATCATDPRSQRFDVVVANLTGGLLIAAAADLMSFARPSGRLVLSGLMADEESAVVAAFPGLAVERRGQEDEWICLELAPDRK